VLSMTQPLPVSYPCIGNIGYGNPSNNSECSSPVIGAGAPPIAGSAFPLDVTSIPTKAVWPYAAQWSFGVQRELPRRLYSTSLM